jgi:hypothetical protein
MIGMKARYLAQESCPVLPEDTPGTLWRRDLKPMGVRMMIELVNGRVLAPNLFIVGL